MQSPCHLMRVDLLILNSFSIFVTISVDEEFWPWWKSTIYFSIYGSMVFGKKKLCGGGLGKKKLIHRTSSCPDPLYNKPWRDNLVRSPWRYNFNHFNHTWRVENIQFFTQSFLRIIFLLILGRVAFRWIVFPLNCVPKWYLFSK